ncbi:UDP-N-acetylglucosamine transferase subunit ALG14 homolog [Symsagittifera roscoffensis]|uniref:UDP-N-acetylglucosamine transferase subunit ALG14 homolog n=1 Tax=Symsagittifera roscoffensis TaxID=84072 RepID=UPI00307B19D7
MTLDILPAFVGSLILAVYLTRFFFLKLKAKTPLSLGSELDRRKKRTLVVLGSGGHTTEMLRLLDHMQKEIYNPRYYFLANTDHMSIKKLKLRSVDPNCIQLIPRSREVGQSYLTSIFSTLLACLSTIPRALWINPDLLMVNGPGTCLPVCIAALITNMLTFNRVTIVFVESICRTETLSLTGKILYRLNIADMFFVQWERLKLTYPKCTYVGRVV